MVDVSALISVILIFKFPSVSILAPHSPAYPNARPRRERLCCHFPSLDLRCVPYEGREFYRGKIQHFSFAKFSIFGSQKLD
jgi:hypothetical protein